MALSTELITPAKLTGYARESLNAYEEKKGTLAAFLPHRMVESDTVRFMRGQYGLIEEAKFRAFGAEPEIGAMKGYDRVTVSLPAIGQNVPVGEYERLRSRNSSDEAALDLILRATDTVVRSVADRLESMRGQVLVTGKASINQANFKSEDDFGRSADMAPSTAKTWTDDAAKPLDDIRAWADKYAELNGELPGTIVASTRVMRLLGKSQAFQYTTVTGGTVSAGRQRIDDVLMGEGLPGITLFDRRTSSGRVIPDDVLLMLPAAVTFDDFEGTQLGATFWGVSDSALKPGWEIAESEQAGIVTGVFEDSKPGAPTEVISDALALPVLANANLALCAKVVL